MGGSGFLLPQYVDLKIKNMTTFPQGLHITFKKGITIIFGGNYSGKTTIVNSIRFAVFGLSWGHALGGAERRYFSSRIREIQRKSLDISIIYQIKPMMFDVCRTIFSSGATEIKAHTSEIKSKALSKPVKDINREKQYYDVLQDSMGPIAEEQLKFIPNLLISGENRQCILWTEGLEEFVLTLLISLDSAKNLKRIESRLIQTECELKKIRHDNERLVKRISEEENVHRFLQRSLKESQTSKIRKYIKEYDNSYQDLEKLNRVIDQLNNKFQFKLDERSNLLQQINKNQDSVRSLELKSEKVRGKWVRAILSPKDPEEFHLSRFLYYEKKCPFCLTDLGDEINARMDAKACLLCGKGSLSEYKEEDLKKIKNQHSNFDKNRKELDQSRKDIEKDLQRIEKEIEKLNESRSIKRSQKSKLTKRLAELKNIEEQLHRRKVISKELEEITREINKNKKLVSQNEEIIKKIEVEIDELRKVDDNAKMAMKTEIESSMSQIRERFSAFIKLATNNEVSGTISENFVPVLNGRQIYHEESASQFERTIMDYAFRIALLSVIAEKTKTTPSLIVETPDEVTDESYAPYLARALLNFTPSLSIIVTTVSTEMMKHLLDPYRPQDRAKRLINLVSKGTLTQRRFYQIPLNQYLRKRE